MAWLPFLPCNVQGWLVDFGLVELYDNNYSNYNNDDNNNNNNNNNNDNKNNNNNDNDNDNNNNNNKNNNNNNNNDNNNDNNDNLYFTRLTQSNTGFYFAEIDFLFDPAATIAMFRIEEK